MKKIILTVLFSLFALITFSQNYNVAVLETLIDDNRFYISVKNYVNYEDLQDEFLIEIKEIEYNYLKENDIITIEKINEKGNTFFKYIKIKD